MLESTPAPVSTSTSTPRCAISTTPSGAIATRCSSVFTSRGTPIFMAPSLRHPGSAAPARRYSSSAHLRYDIAHEAVDGLDRAEVGELAHKAFDALPDVEPEPGGDFVDGSCDHAAP